MDGVPLTSPSNNLPNSCKPCSELTASDCSIWESVGLWGWWRSWGTGFLSNVGFLCGKSLIQNASLGWLRLSWGFSEVCSSYPCLLHSAHLSQESGLHHSMKTLYLLPIPLPLFLQQKSPQDSSCTSASVLVSAFQRTPLTQPLKTIFIGTPYQAYKTYGVIYQPVFAHALSYVKCCHGFHGETKLLQTKKDKCVPVTQTILYKAPLVPWMHAFSKTLRSPGELPYDDVTTSIKLNTVLQLLQKKKPYFCTVGGLCKSLFKCGVMY